MGKKSVSGKKIESFVHDDASRRNIPPAEYQTMVRNQEKTSLQVAYERRNPDLDPQLIWRGKDLLNDSPLVVNAPPLYIQEKIHPKVLIDELKRRSKQRGGDTEQIDLFSAFNGLPSEEAKTEFYQHDQNWSNRMILGDSLQVMASLAEREGLREKVQCIYFDPPYGIKFNSNFQWSTKQTTVKDGRPDHITREPEQVKAFRDTWRDGVNSYLTYLRDRLTASRELLKKTGSIFVQIGDENVHVVRALLDEVFGSSNFISHIVFVKTSTQRTSSIQNVSDHILWYAKEKGSEKFRKLLSPLARSGDVFSSDLTSMNPGYRFEYEYEGSTFTPGRRYWSIDHDKIKRLEKEGRLLKTKNTLRYKRYPSDSPFREITNVWNDTTVSGAEGKTYVVQTSSKVIERCILMSTDPGDLVLDPTCGSGTTAAVSEQWGRRWITIDTSRVALALARTRIMAAQFPFYLLSDSEEGQAREAELNQSIPYPIETNNNLRRGFVYERAPNITLKSLANNKEVDAIWDKWNARLNPILESLNRKAGANYSERELPQDPLQSWPDDVHILHAKFMLERTKRQKEIDNSISGKADFLHLYDRPYQEKSTVRVAGPFTVESLSPHRTMIVDDDDLLVDPHKQGAAAEGATDFAQMIIDTLRVAGVQQAHKEDRINFESLDGWPGSYIASKGAYRDADGSLKTAGIFIGPEFGTVSRVDLVESARECADAGFDVLISCAFNYEAQSTEFDKLGSLPVLKARMNADLHMQPDLKDTGKGNLFVIFGEPDIDILDTPDGKIKLKINGVDVFDPSTGEVRSDEPDTIACWFIDSDYNGESFFVRQAYFLGQNEPYKSLKTSLKAEIDKDAWESLKSDVSVPFGKPSTGRIAVKVINHLGDEVMKVYRVA